MNDNERLSRREMLKNAALGGLGLGLLCTDAVAGNNDPSIESLIEGAAPVGKTMIGVPFEKHATVRIGIIGTGLRGRSVLRELLAVDGA